MKQPYLEAIASLDLINKLRAYQPTLIGTPPLNIDIESSDIDIAFTANYLAGFVSSVTAAYSSQNDFATEYFKTRGNPAVRCVFVYGGWEFELFCQSIPIDEQWGVRHFKVEKRLLQLEPELVDRVVKLKRSGLKTEPAFARILQLTGDPYEAVLQLEKLDNKELLDMVSRVVSPT